MPGTALLAEPYQVTGVDFSPVQIERAHRLVPKARFSCEDIATVELPAQGYAAIVSFFAIIHVPLEEQPAIFRKIKRWLRPGGYLLAMVGSRAWIGIEDDWHGAPMYWATPIGRPTSGGWLRPGSTSTGPDSFPRAPAATRCCWPDGHPERPQYN